MCPRPSGKCTPSTPRSPAAQVQLGLNSDNGWAFYKIWIATNGVETVLREDPNGIAGPAGTYGGFWLDGNTDGLLPCLALSTRVDTTDWLFQDPVTGDNYLALFSPNNWSENVYPSESRDLLTTSFKLRRYGDVARSDSQVAVNTYGPRHSVTTGSPGTLAISTHPGAPSCAASRAACGSSSRTSWAPRSNSC